MPRLSLIELLDLFDRHGRGIAYGHHRGYRMERWSYRRVADTARQGARELEARGVQPGERVMLWGGNCAEWVAAFLGCVLRGAVVVPMDRIAAPDFARRVARDVDAKLMIVSRDLAPAVGAESAKAGQSPAPRIPILVLEDLADTVSRHSSAPFASPPLGRSDLLQIVFTSGTTAEPRGVVITHGNVLANLEPLEKEIAPYLKYERLAHPLRFLNLLPLSHVFGQFLGVFVPPLLGATVFFQETLNPSEVMRTIRTERVSVLIAVPRMLESLRGKIERDVESSGRAEEFREKFAAKDSHFALRWWRFRKIHKLFGWKFWAFISGGAALDEGTEEFWRRLSFVVIQGYGLTETTSLVSVNHPFRLAKGSIGKVLPGRDVKLGASGEILVRGENIASGYWQGGKLETPARAGEDDWFRTGDVGAVDAEGYLYFKGRQKNVIVTPEGMNVYPEDLEKALRLQPEVRDAVVVPLERDKNAEACAVLLLHDAPDATQIIMRTNRTLGEHQRIRHWLVWPEEDFPRTSTQKPRTNVILARVRAQAVAGRKDAALSGSATTAATTSAAGSGSLAELIARVTGRDAEKVLRLGGTALLAENLNLNSLERVELMSAIEDRYQIDLDENNFNAASTVGELENLMHQRAAAAGPRYSYPRWTQHALQRAVRMAVYYLFVWPATHLLAHPRVRGREKLQSLAGPALVICNHVTEIDIGFILAALPARFRHRLAVAMIGELLQKMKHPPQEMNFILRWIERLDYFLVVALFNVFPLPQQGGFRDSFAFAGESADRGYSVLVFPEGRRTPDGNVSAFRAGIGVLAKRLDLPVIPMRIDGLYEVKIAGHRLARPGAIRVSIGEPVRFATDAAPESITRELEGRVAMLEWRER